MSTDAVDPRRERFSDACIGVMRKHPGWLSMRAIIHVVTTSKAHSEFINSLSEIEVAALRDEIVRRRLSK